MTAASLSGTLGNVQLMAFTDAANAEAVHLAAKELGFTRLHIATGSAVEAAAHLRENASPELLLVDITSAESAPEQLDKLADVVNPHTKVLVSGRIDSIRFYQWISDLGVDGYLLQPFTAGELKQAIAKGKVHKGEGKGGDEEKLKKVIAVMGARGGVGTTMVASNLAALFAREHGFNTALMDLDPYFGSTALSLDLEPGRGVRDAFEKPDRVDALFLERVMIKPFDRLSVFSAEEPLGDVIAMQPNAGEMIFAALHEKFNLVVVDVPRQMNPLTRFVLSKADHTIIVAEPQITSLRDSLRIKDYVVDQLKCAAPMLILNRVGLSSTNELSPKEFGKNFGHEVTAQLPLLHEAMTATAQGELLNYLPKLQPALAALQSVAAIIAGADGDAEHSKEGAVSTSLLNRLMGKK